MDDQEDLIDSSRYSSDVTEDVTSFQMHYDDFLTVGKMNPESLLLFQIRSRLPPPTTTQRRSYPRCVRRWSGWRSLRRSRGWRSSPSTTRSSPTSAASSTSQSAGSAPTRWTSRSVSQTLTSYFLANEVTMSIVI